MEEMHHVHVPKRARTAGSGACSHCVAQRERCYIGVRGIPCSGCRRLNLRCDATASPPRRQAKKRAYSPMYCDERSFRSQIYRTVQEKRPQKSSNPAVAATDPLENYISIVNQLLGPEPLTKPISVDMRGYVSGWPNRSDQGDLECRETKRDSVRFRNALLKSYVLWVHPQVPVLDLDHFLCVIAKNDGQNSISPLLYHAVMFVASAFVDISHIHHEGYTSRRAARDVMFRRLKALLDVKCEDDRLTTVQALLLLIHWNDEPHSEEDTSHWMDICLSMAMSIGLHRSSNPSNLTLSQRKTWRRTWWAVYNHVRLTAGDLPSAMILQEGHTDDRIVDTPMVTLNDFEFGVCAPEVRTLVGDCNVLHTVELQKTQALLFVGKTKLCRLSRFSRVANRVSRLVCGADRPETGACSQKRGTNADETEELRRLLLELPAAACHQYPLGLTQTEWDRSAYLHRAWLRLLYFGSMYAACCDQFQAANDNPTHPLTCAESRQADQCLLDITDVFDEVDSLGLSAHLPSPATALLVLALVYHKRPLSTAMSLDQAKRARTLHRCWNMIHKLEETSQLAGRVIAVLKESVPDDVWEDLSLGLLPHERHSLSGGTT